MKIIYKFCLKFYSLITLLFFMLLPPTISEEGASGVTRLLRSETYEMFSRLHVLERRLAQLLSGADVDAIRYGVISELRLLAEESTDFAFESERSQSKILQNLLEYEDYARTAWLSCFEKDKNLGIVLAAKVTANMSTQVLSCMEEVSEYGEILVKYIRARVLEEYLKKAS